MTAELKLQGFEINRKRVIRLMQQEGIAVAKKRCFRKTTDSHHSSPIAPNVLERDFSIGQVNKRFYVSGPGLAVDGCTVAEVTQPRNLKTNGEVELTFFAIPFETTSDVLRFRPGQPIELVHIPVSA